MASTKKAAETAETEKTSIAAETAETEKTVTITIPKRYKGDKVRYVTLNGVPYRCKVGKPIELPESVAAIIQQSIDQRDYYERLVEHLEQSSNTEIK